MFKTKTVVLSALVLMALVCFTACTSGQEGDVVTNNESKNQDEQELDTKTFFGEEYIENNDIVFPKYVLKNIPTDPVKEQKYKLVTPTQEELDEIAVRLDPILSMFLFDYDCEKDNIYEFLFNYDHLGYVYPKYDDEVTEYIAKPLSINVENKTLFWDITSIYKDDPLRVFPISTCHMMKTETWI